MATTTRHMTRRIATDTQVISALVTAGLLDDFDTCDLCDLAAAELFRRIDNTDNAEINVCEHCADTADVRLDADYYA